mmetsp:Transcript_30564/g.90685  ORF Transcript_30564/g.90685 Transcript_30564/m.90685 type:complete len:293 (+) Transcript_30564:564-1442(+)
MPRADTPSRWRPAVTSLAGTGPWPPPPQALATAMAAPMQENGLSLSSDMMRFVTTWRSFERACSCTREPSTSSGSNRSCSARWPASRLATLAVGWSHPCLRQSVLLGRISTSCVSIWMHSFTASGDACRRAPQSGSHWRTLEELADGHQEPLRSSQPKGCRPARRTKSRQPQHQTSSLGLGHWDELSGATAPVGAPRARLGGRDEGRPARPRSATTAWGAASASEVEARRMLVSRRSPCTMLWGRSSWQCCRASNTWRITLASHGSPRGREVECLCCRKAMSSTLSTSSTTM